MQELNIALVVIGGLTLVLSRIAGLMWSKVYGRSGPMLAVAPGIVLGPLGVGWVDFSHWGDPYTIIAQFSRVTVGLAVMAAALRLPQQYFRDHARSMGAVLLSGMWLIVRSSSRRHSTSRSRSRC